MKFTHRAVGPRKAVGNGFVPAKVEPSRKKRRSTLPKAVAPEKYQEKLENRLRFV